MNQTHKVLHHDTLRMFPQQGTSFPRHLMIAFRTLAGPTSQILQLAILTKCHPQVGQGILQSPVNLWLCLHNREIWHCSAAHKSSIAVSSQILFICPTVHCPPLSQVRQSSDQSLTAFGHAPKIPQIWPNFSQMQHIMWITDQFRAFSLCLSLQTKLWNPNLLILFVREIENVLFELKTTRFSNCCNLRQKFRTQIRLYFGYS